jgi:hypothetical protein
MADFTYYTDSPFGAVRHQAEGMAQFHIPNSRTTDYD